MGIKIWPCCKKEDEQDHVLQQECEEYMEEEMNHREEDLILPFEELPSFVEDDEEEVVPPFEEQNMAFEPLTKDVPLL
jgi:hypothetical protein